LSDMEGLRLEKWDAREDSLAGAAGQRRKAKDQGASFSSCFSALIWS
jgi:hypothetical protein